MQGLRYAAVLALAMWIGGLVALGGIGAPAIFAVLEAHDPVAGRELAGQVFGVIFVKFQYVAMALAGIVIASLGARAALGPRPRRFKLRLWSVAAMLSLSAVATFWITPRIDTLRTSVHAPMASLAATDPRRITFGRLHGASNGLMALTLVVGIALLWAEATDQH